MFTLGFTLCWTTDGTLEYFENVSQRWNFYRSLEFNNFYGSITLRNKRSKYENIKFGKQTHFYALHFEYYQNIDFLSFELKGRQIKNSN